MKPMITMPALDHLDSSIPISLLLDFPHALYVADEQDLTLLFANRELLSKLDRDPLGQTCFKALYHYEEPCPFCILKGDCSPPVSHPQVVLTPWKAAYRVTTRKVTWAAGTNAVMGVLTEVNCPTKATPSHSHQIPFRRLVEGANCLILQLDTAGQIRYANPFVFEFFELEAEQIIGRSMEEVFLPPHTPSTLELFAMLQEVLSHPKRKTTFVLQNLRKGGRIAWVAWTATALLNPRGEVEGIVCVGQDITERKQTEQQLERANRELEYINTQLQDAIERANQLAIAAEAANVAKGRFLANISHEIRTPLNGIMGMTQLVLDTQVTEQQREYLEMVMVSADSLLRLVNDLLDFTKIEADAIEIKKDPFRLREFLDTLSRSFAVQAQQKGLELIFYVDPKVPDELIGDEARLRQVFVNLLGNAVKFTHDGYVFLEVKREKVYRRKATLSFMVMDTGSGVPEHLRDSIFNPFVQGDNTPCSAQGGTGLGLAISRQLVERMGGTIWVESPCPHGDLPVGGPGSAFCVRLTFELHRPYRRPRAPKTWQGKSAAILVRPGPILENLQRLMESLGIIPLEAQHILEIKEGLAPENHPDVLLVDGYFLSSNPHLTSWLGHNPPLSERTILITCAIPTLAERNASALLPNCPTLVKPIRERELKEALSCLFRARAAPDPKDNSGGQLQKGRPPRSPEYGNPKVLLVEDNPTNRVWIQNMLRKRGWDVTSASCGQEALRIVDEGNVFDIILLDLQMPLMDGFDTARQIRKRFRNRPNPPSILAFTAHDEGHVRERCEQAGIDDVCTKTSDIDLLSQKMTSMLLHPGKFSTLKEGCMAVNHAPKSHASDGVESLKQAILQKLDGDEQLMRELIKIFLKDAPKRLRIIQRALQLADPQSLEREAHALKGSASYLCARDLEDKARQLQRQAARGSLEDADRLFVCVKEEVMRLRTMLEQVLMSEHLKPPVGGGTESGQETR